MAHLPRANLTPLVSPRTDQRAPLHLSRGTLLHATNLSHAARSCDKARDGHAQSLCTVTTVVTTVVHALVVHAFITVQHATSLPLTTHVPATRNHAAASTTRLNASSTSGGKLGADTTGGEGVAQILKARGTSGTAGSSYWLPTLLALEGRSFPVQPLATYMAYCAASIALLTTNMPEFTDAQRAGLSAVQSAGNTIGESLRGWCGCVLPLSALALNVT